MMSRILITVSMMGVTVLASCATSSTKPGVSGDNGSDFLVSADAEMASVSETTNTTPAPAPPSPRSTDGATGSTPRNTQPGVNRIRAGGPVAGPIGKWPWALRACEGTPDAYYGDYEASLQSADANNNGTPDVVEGTRKPHFWYDPGAPGIASPAQGDPNGNGVGDTLDAALDVLSARGGGTLAIIGLGIDRPYIMQPYTAGQRTEHSGAVWATVNGNVEICAVEDVAVFQSATPGTDIVFNIRGNHDLIVKNIKWDGVVLNFAKEAQTSRYWFENVWQGNVRQECPMLADNLNNNQNTLARPNTSVPSMSGGGTHEDPVTHTHIKYEDTQMYNCDSNRDHHNMYWNPEGCFFQASNTIWEGASGLEVFRQLCRAVLIEDSYLANTLDWSGSSHGASVMDMRSSQVAILRNNIFRVMTSGSNPAYAVVPRSRRDNTGSGMPNQWPGSDADVDDYAGNDDWSGDGYPALTALLSAPANDDAWLHDGKVWNRHFWREVTSAPWRADQRELTLSGASGYAPHETITGSTSGANGTIWKIVGNTYHVTLNSATEFTDGESVGGGGSGTLTTQAAVTAQAIGENEHLFPIYFSGNVFEAKCASASCSALHPFVSFGTLPGAGAPGNRNANRYFIVPLDTDADQFPGDGYDTEATPGDGWVERSISFAMNNTFTGDWSSNNFSGNTDQVLTYSDGVYSITAYEASPLGPPSQGSPAGAVTPANAPPYFVLDLGGTAETPLALPDWWPQGTVHTICDTLKNRYGDDPDDPDDYHWWDEPGAETRHRKLNHDGFPKGACN